MINKYEYIILIILFLLNIIINDIDTYFTLIYIIIFLYYIFKLYRIILLETINKKYSIIKFLLTSIVHFFFSYLAICDPNPFYYLFTFYLPFANFFKAVFILIFHSYFINKDNELLNSKIIIQSVKICNSNFFPETNHFFLSDIIYYFKNNKKKIFQFIAYLVIIKILMIYYSSKLWIHFMKKKSILPLSTERNTIFYITGCIANKESIIVDFITEMKKVINYLGEKNVIVSIVENGDSEDNTRKYLKEFKYYLDSLSVINKFVLTHEIEDPRKNPGVTKKQNQYLRIKYLADLRNKCFDLLYKIPNLDFNNLKIININDIIFSYEDVIKLLATNNEDHDVVCAMDYDFYFYDIWVSIDLDGNRLLEQFPYFINKEGQDLYINKRSIRIFSCWNGIIAFNASALKDKKLEFRVDNFNISELTMGQFDLKTNIKDQYESECTYFHIDMESLGFTKRFINPEVKVAYTYPYYYFSKYIFPNTLEFFFYFKNYFKGLFTKRNKKMADLKSKSVNLSPVLYNWYLYHKKNGTKLSKKKR